MPHVVEGTDLWISHSFWGVYENLKTTVFNGYEFSSGQRSYLDHSLADRVGNVKLDFEKYWKSWKEWQKKEHFSILSAVTLDFVPICMQMWARGNAGQSFISDLWICMERRWLTNKQCHRWIIWLSKKNANLKAAWLTVFRESGVNNTFYSLKGLDCTLAFCYGKKYVTIFLN